MTSSPQPPTDQPLDMTVHALPLSAEPAASDARRARIGRIKMLLVLLLCASPVIASYFTYYVIRPEGRRNYGELVEQRTMPAALMGVDLNPGLSQPQPPRPLTQLRDQWLLVSVAGSGCNAACEKQLYLQRQLREGLGKEKERLEWVWLINDSAPMREALKPALSAPSNGAQVWRVGADALAGWLAPQPGKNLEDHLYVIDPIGNFMMRFPADIDPGRAKRDLDRLLRASRHWDTAGRDPVAAAKLPTAPASK